MQPSYKKLLLQSNKELTVFGDMEVLILVGMHTSINRATMEDILSANFDKGQRETVLSVLDDEYLKIISKNP